MTVLVQREVADRILSPPHAKTYGPLSVGMQHYASPRSGFLVPPGAFRPPPKVHSRAIGLEWREGVEDDWDFIAFVGRAFASRRKKLINNLTSAMPHRTRSDLEQAMQVSGLDLGLRPENLSPNQFLALWRALRD